MIPAGAISDRPGDQQNQFLINGNDVSNAEPTQVDESQFCFADRVVELSHHHRNPIFAKHWPTKADVQFLATRCDTFDVDTVLSNPLTAVAD